MAVSGNEMTETGCERTARETAEKDLTQTAVYRLDQEPSYPVDRNAHGSTRMQSDLAHDVIMRDATHSDRKHKDHERAGRRLRLTCVSSAGRLS